MFKKIPHTFVIIFFIIIVAAIMTWFFPAGEFERTEKILPDGSSRSVIVEGSFQEVEAEPQTWQVFSAIFDGFVNQSNIIIFILLIGGAFWIMNESKALDVGIFSFLRFTKKLERFKFLRFFGVNNIVMVLIMLMFSLFGAIFGMSEETIAFVIIMIPLAISMGYDSIVGLCLVYVAAHLGFAGALLNPFTIGIAQGLSDIPIFSGIEYRLFCWLLINAVGFSFVLIYAARIKKNPKRSPMYELDEYWRKKKSISESEVSYHTPLSAWVSYGILVIIMAIVSYLFPFSSLQIGNSIYTMPIIPILTALFAFLGIISLRKSVHFFILNLLNFIWNINKKV